MDNYPSPPLPPSYSETVDHKNGNGQPPYPLNPEFSYQANPVSADAPCSSIPQILPPTTITLVQATTPLFGPHPVATDCSYCHQHIVTSTESTPGALPWIIALILFLLGFLCLLPWCLCFIPFCIDSCLDVVHRCPACHHELATYRRL